MKKFFGGIFHKLNTRLNRILLLVFGLLLVIGAAILLKNSAPNMTDNDPERGAAVIKNDTFGDHYDKTAYLDQGWSNAESLWFYNTTQGSNLIPYDFFMVLEKVDGQELFRSEANMNHYRYLIQKATSSDPDGLPLGMVQDTYKNKQYLGFTCAACHTSQVNYNGTGIRIDGGQTMADMQNFMTDLSSAINTTLKDEAKKKRFVEAVLKRGNYKNEADVLADLSVFSVRIGLDNLSNLGSSAADNIQYGYGRLDAFGRIYNRVLVSILRKEDIQTLLSEITPPLSQKEIDDILAKLEKKVISNNSRDHLLEQLSSLLTPTQRAQMIQKTFNPSSAPVSYPFLWDTPQHDFVQWNGVGINAGPGPLGRNTGEVIGVFGTMDWSEDKGWTIASWLAGQGIFTKTHINFDSSINLHNLNLLESQLSKLHSPVWPQNILPKLDQNRIAKGEIVFNNYCIGCHQPIVRDDPDRHVIANFTSVDSVGTDPTMAKNGVEWKGLSGILTNQYVGIGIGNTYLKGKAPVFALLSSATINVVLATSDPDKSIFERAADKIYDTFWIEPNTIKASLKNGNYVPDTTNNPLTSLMAYKGRSLNGIWATAPYMHNGSVPTLYDLLLPACQRPKTFLTGSREFDPIHVGFKSEGYDGFTFDTSLIGNKNIGHEYGKSDATCPDGSVVHNALTEDERMNLLEYLKNQ